VKAAYIDPVSGISGDMFVACFLDAGLEFETLKAGLDSLPLKGYEISYKKVVRKGLSATLFAVEVASKAHEHRNLPTILSLIQDSGLSRPVRDTASATFRALAEAEGAVHGVSPEDVGFHEVGAVDSIVDIVGAAIAVDAMGVQELLVGPLPSGRGTVQSAHGPLPIPAPATARLLAGFDLVLTDVEGELVTPTGAALLKAVGRPLEGRAPSIRIEAVGYGAGTKEFEGLPNVVRVFLGELRDEAGSSRALDVIETTVDDASPQIFGYLIERLLKDGAYDVFTTPVVMKKSRPGVNLTVLAPPERTDALTGVIFRETPTLGVRVCRGWRRELRRKQETVTTAFGEIDIKVSLDDEGSARGIPEYDSCASAAKAHDLPFWQVWNEARRAWEKAQKE
jgi:uncharacterized protein (TIGR00299 family) protein